MTKTEKDSSPSHRGNHYPPPPEATDFPAAALSGDYLRFGFFADQHMCSVKERLDIQEDAYDTFEREGLKVVLNAGNWIDGESRFNTYEVHVRGFDAQIRYARENWPRRNGIVTHYISGDDHEGWYQKSFGVDVGKRLEQDARDNGRDDLVHLGYVEHDFTLPGGGHLRLMHPGGGTALSLSLTPQRIIESFDACDRPDVLLLGHYHKAEMMPEYCGTICVQGGCMQEQTVWQRKKRIRPYLGYWIIEMMIGQDGRIRRFRPEWFGGFSRGFQPHRFS